MVKVHKLTVYVLDGINNSHTQEQIKSLLDSKYLDGVKVTSIESKDVGEWSDDHPLNKSYTDYDNYFSKL